MSAHFGDVVRNDLDRPSVEAEDLVCGLCNAPEGLDAV